MQALRQARAAPAAAARGASAINPLAGAPLRPSSSPKRGATLARRAIELDFSDPDTLVSIAGVVLGLAMGIGAPVWYASRADRDEELLEEVRALNRANYEATGEYLTEVSEWYMALSPAFAARARAHPTVGRAARASGREEPGARTRRARLWRSARPPRKRQSTHSQPPPPIHPPPPKNPQQEEIATIRKPKWTDGREFQDND